MKDFLLNVIKGATDQLRHGEVVNEAVNGSVTHYVRREIKKAQKNRSQSRA